MMEDMGVKMIWDSSEEREKKKKKTLFPMYV